MNQTPVDHVQISSGEHRIGKEVVFSGAEFMLVTAYLTLLTSAPIGLGSITDAFYLGMLLILVYSSIKSKGWKSKLKNLARFLFSIVKGFSLFLFVYLVYAYRGIDDVPLWIKIDTSLISGGVVVWLSTQFALIEKNRGEVGFKMLQALLFTIFCALILFKLGLNFKEGINAFVLLWVVTYRVISFVEGWKSARQDFDKKFDKENIFQTLIVLFFILGAGVLFSWLLIECINARFFDKVVAMIGVWGYGAFGAAIAALVRDAAKKKQVETA